jgi:hypothetical protein
MDACPELVLLTTKALIFSQRGGEHLKKRCIFAFSDQFALKVLRENIQKAIRPTTPIADAEAKGTLVPKLSHSHPAMVLLIKIFRGTCFQSLCSTPIFDSNLY